MPYHTAGGWIQAFNQALARSGRVVPHIQTHFCGEHANCILVVHDKQKDHVPWRETEPAAAAASILSRQP
jgi:hypothetical protein